LNGIYIKDENILYVMATLYMRFLSLINRKSIFAHVADARTVFCPELEKACITLDWPRELNIKSIESIECVKGQITIVVTTDPPA
jgi:hypothetical protein